MKSLERITTAVKFQKPDRFPVIAQVFGHAATLAGVTLGDYIRDGELLARCQLKALQQYGYDAVFAAMDLNVETEAVGSVLTYRENQYPFVKSYVAGAKHINNLVVPDPHQAGRMPELLKAADIMRRELGDDVLVAGLVSGPMTLAVQLMGAEKTLYFAADAPEEFVELLHFASDVIISFGLAQLEAGVHLPMVFEPAASPAVIPPQFFREFVLPQLKRIFGVFKERGAAVNWLHTAGPVKPILPYYPEAGVELANIDYSVDPHEACQILPQTCLDGNIMSLSFVEANPEEIAVESARLLDLFTGRGGFILSSGCEIPPESKPENIAAMVLAARNQK